MKESTSFFAGMVVLLYECNGCTKTSAVAEFPETLDIKYIRRKMGFTKHFEHGGFEQ